MQTSKQLYTLLDRLGLLGDALAEDPRLPQVRRLLTATETAQTAPVPGSAESPSLLFVAPETVGARVPRASSSSFIVSRRPAQTIIRRPVPYHGH